MYPAWRELTVKSVGPEVQLGPLGLISEGGKLAGSLFCLANLRAIGELKLVLC